MPILSRYIGVYSIGAAAHIYITPKNLTLFPGRASWIAKKLSFSASVHLAHFVDGGFAAPAPPLVLPSSCRAHTLWLKSRLSGRTKLDHPGTYIPRESNIDGYYLRWNIVIAAKYCFCFVYLALFNFFLKKKTQSIKTPPNPAIFLFLVLYICAYGNFFSLFFLLLHACKKKEQNLTPKTMFSSVNN